MADKIATNIRDLEGALNRLMCFCEFNKVDTVDMSIAQQVLKDVFDADEAPKLTVSAVMRAVGDYYQLSLDDLRSKRKDRDVSFPRQIAMYLCRELIGATTTQIGRDFGGRHYTTVMYACDAITNQRMRDADLDHTLYELERLLKRK